MIGLARANVFSNPRRLRPIAVRSRRECVYESGNQKEAGDGSARAGVHSATARHKQPRPGLGGGSSAGTADPVGPAGATAAGWTDRNARGNRTEARPPAA